ncbi:MAG: stage II sporulation protein E [Syntrophomonadaceae bacterium]|nr:stage II sporulation protein E [Syntrophomonadaceae bacterium]
MLSWLDLETIALWAVAFLLGRSFILGEILPFAVAYTAAFATRNRKLAWGIPLFSIIGLFTMAEGQLLWSNVVAIIGTAALPWRITLTDRRRWVALPLMTAAVIIVAKTAALLLTSATYYMEVIVLFEAITAGILTFVIMVAREALEKQISPREFSFEDMTAWVILGVGELIGLSGLQLIGFSIAGIASRQAILLAALVCGIGGGAVVGVAVGVIPSVATLALPKALAIYALSGLLAGVFRDFGRVGVVLGFVTGNMIMSVFLMNSDQALLSIFETLLGVAVFMALPRDIEERMPLKSLGRLGETGREEFDGSEIKEWTAERMNNLARVFEEISMTFAESDPIKSDGAQPVYVGRIMEDIAEGLCTNCAIHSTCWEKEFYQTYRDFFNLMSLMELKGEVSYDDLPVEVRRRCLRARELGGVVKRVMQTAQVNDYWEEKIEESRDMLSQQLKGVSGLIKNLAQEIDFKTVVDTELQTKLTQECKDLGVPVRQVLPVVSDTDQVFIRITADACLDRETCDNILAPAISCLMETRYEVSYRKCPRGSWGTCECTLARAFNYKVTTGVSQLAKADVSGDSFNIVTLKDGRELIVLCDGMGRGRKAAQESKATVNLLEELFNIGFGQEVALKTINSILMLRQRESFVTVDLALIDLYSGELDSIKIGGGPSFLKRGPRVGIISSNNLPIGIVEEVDFPTEKRALIPGDILVLVTDGIIDPGKLVDGRGLWLRDYLAQTNENDPHRLSEMIINKALALARGEPRDDMSVVCARVEYNIR